MRGIYKRGKTWWIDYVVGGQRFQESAKTQERKEALRIRAERLTKRTAGELQGRPERVVFAKYVEGEDGKEQLVGGLRALVEQDYKMRGNRSLDRAIIALDHLEEYVGADAKAPSITATRVDGYAEHRLAEGASRASINYEKAILRRGFRLAVKKGLLVSVPNIETPKVDNRRSGFFDSGEVAALKVELTADVWSLVEFLLYTGWRRDEGRLLTWASVDWEGHTLRLESARSKSGEPRVFPFRLAPDLKTLLEARWAARDGLHVFHRHGQPLGVGAVRSAWKRGTVRAGLDGRLVHDLRRTAARDMRRQGLSESDIMALCGWETLSMFQRYAIRDEAALEAAVGKRFGVRDKNVTTEGVAESTNSVNASSTT